MTSEPAPAKKAKKSKTGRLTTNLNKRSSSLKLDTEAVESHDSAKVSTTAQDIERSLPHSGGPIVIHAPNYLALRALLNVYGRAWRVALSGMKMSSPTVVSYLFYYHLNL